MTDLETKPWASDNSILNGAKVRLSTLLRSGGARQSLFIGTSMILAGALDYGVNVVAGRWLAPVEYGVFVSVTAILQALLFPAMAIRVVVAFYTVDVSVLGDSGQVGKFLRGVLRWAWQWGCAVATLLVIVSPLVARLLRIPNTRPLWAASLMVLMLVLRESTFGALQGIQAFTGLGLVQVVQSLLRLFFAAGIIWWGWRAAGAILAQPLGCAIGLGLVFWWLRPYVRNASKAAGPQVSWRYSAYTLFGLGIFGILTNLDPLFVKHFFSPEMAGNYAPVVTLAKVSLFLPWAIAIVLLPKVKQYQSVGRDARPILLLALAGALAPGLGTTVLYFLSPGLLVRILFTGAYANPGIVLALASLAASLYAGMYIWLNYSLSLDRPAFVYVLLGVLVWQGLGMYFFGRDSLVSMTLVMVSAGVIGNLAGLVTAWLPVPKPGAVTIEEEVVRQ
jgi:O-antigen/teichoic acid export membrane protein